MCFHIFAPGATLTIEHVAESIELLEGGRSRVAVDIIVTNGSNNDVNELHILYPRSFTRPSKSMEKIEVDIAAADISHTILSEDALHNIKYNVGGYSLIYEKVTGTDNEYYMLFGFPDQEVPYQDTPDSPIACWLTKNEIETVNSGLKFAKYYKGSRSPIKFIAFLDEINFSILGYKFPASLKPGQCQFIRLQFGPYISSLCGNNFLPDLIKRYFSHLEYYYEIASPYDVIHRFIVRSRLQIKFLTDTLDRVIVEEIIRLISIVEKSRTEYKRWKLDIYPKEFAFLHDIVMVGSIQPLGTLPNNNNDLIDVYYPSRFGGSRPWSFGLGAIISRVRETYAAFQSFERRSYNFITTPRSLPWCDIVKLDKKCGFRLYFSAKPTSYSRQIVLQIIIFSIFYIVILKPIIELSLDFVLNALSLVDTHVSWFSQSIVEYIKRVFERLNKYEHENPVRFHFQFAIGVFAAEKICSILFHRIANKVKTLTRRTANRGR